jgi:hypothetical protein
MPFNPLNRGGLPADNVSRLESNPTAAMNGSPDVYEIRPRKDRRGFDLISDRLPLGLLWFEGPDAFGEAVRYAKFFSRSQPAVIRLFDQSGAVIETHEHAGGFQRVVKRIGCPVLIRWRTTDPRQRHYGMNFLHCFRPSRSREFPDAWRRPRLREVQ